MINYDYKTEQYLIKVWETAYSKGNILVPIPNPENPISAIVHYNKIINYRRAVRNLRLNPLFKDLWTKIAKCTAGKPNLGDKHIRIRRKSSLEFKRKIKMDYAKHPINKFNFPTGVASDKT